MTNGPRLELYMHTVLGLVYGGFLGFVLLALVVVAFLAADAIV